MPRLSKTFAVVAAGTAIEVFAAPGTGYKNRVTGLSLSLSASGSFQFLKADGTTVLWQSPVIPAETVTPFTLEGLSIKNPTADNAIKIKTSVSANITGTVDGYSYRAER